MKEEIKEILDYFKRSNKNKLGFEQDKIITYKEANQLLDYITNLQEEIERLNNIINECAEDILKELEKHYHLSYGVALGIRQKLIDYRELKGE